MFVEELVEAADEKFTDSGTVSTEDEKDSDVEKKVICNGKEAFTLQQQKL